MKKFKNLEKQALKMASQYNLSDNNIKNGIVYWGEHNDLPEKYLSAYGDVVNPDKGISYGSTWNGTSIDGIVKLIVSNGLAFENPNEELPSANNLGESLNDILEKLAYDWKILGGFSVEVIWDRGSVAGTSDMRIAEIYHVPMKNCRASEKNDFGRIPGWYISSRWGKRKNPARNAEDAEFIPSFNPNLVTSREVNGENVLGQGKQILVCMRHNPNNDYYPEPDYKSGLIDIFTDALIRKSKISMLNSSIVSSSVIQVVTGGMKPEDKEDFLDDLESNYQGTINHGTPLVLEAQSGNDLHQITTPGNLKNVTEAFTGYEENVQQRILSAHQITFSEVVGVSQENAGLGSDQIMQKFSTFMNFSIRPHQTKILSALNRLMVYIRPDNRFVINPINLFAGSQGENISDVVDQEQDTSNVTSQNS